MNRCTCGHYRGAHGDQRDVDRARCMWPGCTCGYFETDQDASRRSHITESMEAAHYVMAYVVAEDDELVDWGWSY